MPVLEHGQKPSQIARTRWPHSRPIQGRGYCSASDLLEELAAGELFVVGEDGGAHQDALQDLVVVDGWQAEDVVAGLGGVRPRWEVRRRRMFTVSRASPLEAVSRSDSAPSSLGARPTQGHLSRAG